MNAKKIISLLLMAVICLSLLVGCAKALPEGFDRDLLSESAKKLITDMGGANYGAVISELGSELKTVLTEDYFKTNIAPIYTAAGEFKKFGNTTMSATQDESNGEYIVVVVACGYANGTLTYTISYNKDMQVIGLFMK